MASEGLTVMAPEVIALLDRGVAVWRVGRLAEAQEHLQAGLAQATAQRCVSGMLSARSLLGSLAYVCGAFTEAEEHHRAVLAQCRHLGMRLGVASSLHNLGLLAAMRGDAGGAVRLIDRAISLYEGLGEHESADRARANRSALIAGRTTTHY